MSIILPARDDAPLQQGDLLEGLVTFSTKAVSAEPIGEQGGRVLVVSRNCQAIRASQVTVARVRTRQVDLKSAPTPAELHAMLVGLRDGVESPDSFYLGEFGGENSGRHFAKFDALYSIGVPTVPAERVSWLKEHRKWRLAPDFCHDLHQRLFHAFASMGFDDDHWWSDGDLSLLLTMGRAAILTKRASIEEASARLQVLRESGGNNREEKGQRVQQEEAQKQLDNLNALLAPLEAEATRRGLQSS